MKGAAKGVVGSFGRLGRARIVGIGIGFLGSLT